jgi:hypothetical protein
MTKKPTKKVLREKIIELKKTLQELQIAIENELGPLNEMQTQRFGISSYQGKKILIDTAWRKLFYKYTHGKDFLKDHFDIPEAIGGGNLEITYSGKSIKVMSDIPEIKNKFRKSFDTTIKEKLIQKTSTLNAKGKDTNKLIDIFNLIREYLLKEVQSLDSNQEELMNRLSEIEGDLYELRHSTDQLIKIRIKRSKQEIGTKVIIGFLVMLYIIIAFIYYKD